MNTQPPPPTAVASATPSLVSDRSLAARVAALEAQLAALSNAHRRRRRTAAIAVLAGLVLVPGAVTAQQFGFPSGWNVFGAGTPARASDVNDNFQWILEKIGTDPTRLDLEGDLRVAGGITNDAGAVSVADSLAVRDDSALGGPIWNPGGDVVVQDGLSVTGSVQVVGSQQVDGNQNVGGNLQVNGHAHGLNLGHVIVQGPSGSGGNATLQAACPSGSLVVGGGVRNDTAFNDVVYSRPDGTTGWVARVTGSNAAAASAFAICLRVR